MSQYTIQLRWLIEQAEKDAHGSYTPFEYTDATWRALGLDSYPIYDESYRDKLNSMICDHYYMREIGQEAPGLFRLIMRRTMNEIMPYYNELYRLASMEYDPLKEIDVTRVTNWNDKSDRTWDSSSNGQWTNDSNGTNESTTTGSSSNIYSDTPMSMVEDDGATLVENGKYATNVTFDKSTSSNNATTGSSANGTTDNSSNGKDGTTRGGDRTETESGHRKSIPELIQEWRRAILNVNREIVESSELAECFMLCY